MHECIAQYRAERRQSIWPHICLCGTNARTFCGRGETLFARTWTSERTSAPTQNKHAHRTLEVIGGTVWRCFVCSDLSTLVHSITTAATQTRRRANTARWEHYNVCLLGQFSWPWKMERGKMEQDSWEIESSTITKNLRHLHHFTSSKLCNVIMFSIVNKSAMFSTFLQYWSDVVTDLKCHLANAYNANYTRTNCAVVCACASRLLLFECRDVSNMSNASLETTTHHKVTTPAFRFGVVAPAGMPIFQCRP